MQCSELPAAEDAQRGRLSTHIGMPQALRILSHSADAEIDNPDTPLALWDKLEKEVRGGFLGMLTVRATFQLRQAGLAAKRYEHIALVSRVSCH
jgi:hypothetical protein